jgi:hypothetical protein
MLVCVSLPNLARETAGAARTRSSLRPLISWGGDFMHASDATRREIVELHLLILPLVTIGVILRSTSDAQARQGSRAGERT